MRRSRERSGSRPPRFQQTIVSQHVLHDSEHLLSCDRLHFPEAAPTEKSSENLLKGGSTTTVHQLVQVLLFHRSFTQEESRIPNIGFFVLTEQLF